MSRMSEAANAIFNRLMLIRGFTYPQEPAQVFVEELACQLATAGPIQSVAGKTGDVTLDSGDVDFIAPGTGAVTRTVQDRLRDDAVSVVDYQTALATDDTAAFQAAINTGRPVKVPYRATPYLFSNWINMLSGSYIFGEGRPTLKAKDGTQCRIFRVVNVSNVRIEGLVMDGNKANVVTKRGVFYLQDSTDVQLINCDLLNGGGNNSFFASDNVVERITITGGKVANCDGTAIDLGGASRCIVRDVEIRDNVGFGVRLSLGANYNLISGVWSSSNGIELVGVVYDSHDNRIIGCRSELSGDNGFSISGYRNTVIGNIAYKARYSGIQFYGKQNTGTGNICVSSGQAQNPSSIYYDAANTIQYAGIIVGGGYGGTAQNNVVTGNYCDDDQTVPTQSYGWKVNGPVYTSWTATTAVATGAFWRAGVGPNLYLCTVGGITGSTAPSHTSGTATDGTVTWLYVDTFAGGTSEGYGNVIASNRVFRFKTGSFLDGTINHNNSILAEDHIEFFGSGGLNTITAGFQRRGAGWASGQTVTYGNVRFNTSTGTVYRCTNAGGTTSGSAPTHSTGIVTGADGIAWLTIGVGQQVQQVLINQNDVRVGSTLMLPVVENTSYVYEFAGIGTPEGKVTAPPGSRYARQDGGAGTCFYVKESGTGATGWVAK